jgi:hypothetical protein
MISSFAFLPGNKIVAAGVSGQLVRMWDIPSGRERTTAPGHLIAVKALAFARDAKTLLSAGGDGVRVHELATGKEVSWFAPSDRSSRRLPLPGHQSDAFLSSDGRYFIWGAQPQLKVVDLSSRKQIADLPAQRGVLGSAAAFAPDDSAFVSLAEEMPGKNAQVVAQVCALEGIGHFLKRARLLHVFEFIEMLLAPSQNRHKSRGRISYHDLHGAAIPVQEGGVYPATRTASRMMIRSRADIDVFAA